VTAGAQDVTVVVTTHNRCAAVVRAVQSVRAQSRPATEIVVVDDGSEPPVVDLGHDVRVVRHDVPRGVCAARNSGVEAAEGHYLLFLDDDDVLPPEALEHSLRAVETSQLPEPVAALGALAIVDEQDDVLDIHHPPTFRRGSAWLFDSRPAGTTLNVQNTLLVPKQVVEEIGGWNENLRSWVHDDFFLRLARACSLQGIDQVTYHRLDQTDARQHVSRQMSARAASMEQTLAAHEEAFRAHPRRHGKYLGTIAITWLRCGEGRRARVAAWRSFRVYPARPKALVQLAACLAGPGVYSGLARIRGRRGQAGPVVQGEAGAR
jgi:glycosyltransferase involved in cell wall biosynthesis